MYDAWQTHHDSHMYIIYLLEFVVGSYNPLDVMNSVTKLS